MTDQLPSAGVPLGFENALELHYERPNGTQVIL